MKIAMVGHKRIPSRLGGVEIVVEELAVRMAALGHDVYVYNRNSGEEKLKTYKNIHLIEVPAPKHSSLNALVYSALATLHLLFRKYDIVHYHAEGPCAMLPIARLFGKKTVATIHGLDWQRAKWGGFATRYLLLGEKYAAKYAGKLIVLSRNLQNYFRDKYHRESVLIPNGMNAVVPAEPDIIGKYGVSGKDYILFLARITPEKGLHYLLEAFRGIETDKKLIVAGALDPATPYIDEIREKAGEDDRVKLIGFVQGREMAELFSNCYLYVLPSDLEGMPVSLLEAVSYRARVLVSDIPENTEVLGEYGHVFKKGDVQLLKACLLHILGNESLYEQDFKEDQDTREVQERIDRMIEEHDWDRITKETLALYEQAIQ